MVVIRNQDILIQHHPKLFRSRCQTEKNIFMMTPHFSLSPKETQHVLENGKKNRSKYRKMERRGLALNIVLRYLLVYLAHRLFLGALVQLKARERQEDRDSSNLIFFEMGMWTGSSLDRECGINEAYYDIGLADNRLAPVSFFTFFFFFWRSVQ